jgi:hypothetical protein
MSALDPAYSAFGDSKGGFRTSAGAGVLRVKGWGFWPKDVAKAFGPAVCGACRKMPGVRSLDLDMTGLQPMRDEGQEGFAQIMSAISEMSLSEVVITTSSHITKLQLLRLAREKAPKGVVRFVEGSAYS